jgi:hypothetical protein
MSVEEMPSEKWKFKVTVTFDAATGVMSVDGCDKNPIISLGMLDYALARVRRFITTNDILQEAKQVPRISLPGGPLA